jgi:O-succinylbenzoate synthase
MRIDAVELFHVRMRLKHPFETSFGVEIDRDCVILHLLSEGMEGWGECVASNFPGYSYETVGTAWNMLVEFFIPQILGKQLITIEDYRRSIAHLKGHPLARAGLEMAIWDVMSKAQGVSLAQLFGGMQEKVAVGVSVGLEQDVQRILGEVETYLGQGYKRIKLKIKPGKDIEVIQQVRETYPRIALQVDANSAYTLENIDLFQSFDRYDLLMIEQPLEEDDLIDHSTLQSTLKTAICLDESIRNLHHAKQALQIGACKVINIKPARVGGLFEAKAIHDHCLEQNVPVWCGGMLETNIGRASNLAIASLPGFVLPGDISASERYYEQDIADPNFVLNVDSTIDVPRGPGLGVNVNLAALEKMTLRREALKA